MKRREVGILGEQIARDFLGKNGYLILETNYRCTEGEIDIVARQGECLVFVEVKARRGLEFGSPEESITPAKMKKLRKASARYLQDHENHHDSWRIDVVAIEMDRKGRATRIEIVENAVGGD